MTKAELENTIKSLNARIEAGSGNYRAYCEKVKKQKTALLDTLCGLLCERDRLYTLLELRDYKR